MEWIGFQNNILLSKSDPKKSLTSYLWCFPWKHVPQERQCPSLRLSVLIEYRNTILIKKKSFLSIGFSFFWLADSQTLSYWRCNRPLQSLQLQLNRMTVYPPDTYIYFHDNDVYLTSKEITRPTGKDLSRYIKYTSQWGKSIWKYCPLPLKVNTAWWKTHSSLHPHKIDVAWRGLLLLVGSCSK